jgi:replicative DNA helicase
MRKLPPHSNEIEETIIASVFLDGITTIQACLDKKVCEDSFFKDENRLLWKTFIWAFKRGTPLEIDAISTALLEKDKLGKVGGTEYLLKVTNRVPTTVGTKHAIDKLQELYMLREIISRSNQLIENAHSFNGDFSVFTAQIEDALRIREGLEKQLTLNDACDSINDRLDRIARGELKEGDNGMAWPWKDATRYLGPIQNGELVIIAARPSRGKSSVARQLAWCWSQRYGNVMLFSREMPVGELPPLFAQSLSGSSWREARNGRLSLKEVDALKEGMKEVKSNLALKVFDRDRTLSQIVARIKAQCLQVKPCAVVIDYLQAYDVEQTKGETRDVAIGRFTRAMKDLAIDLNMPVILLAQIGRSVEKEEREPRLSDIRESGNIEQDADRCVFVHWAAKKTDGEPQDLNDQNNIEIECSLIQAKGRGEGQATCQLVFHRPTATFKSVG